MAKHKKMTPEQKAQYQANIDYARELLIKNGFKPPVPAPQPKKN
jgi:hypothetical protein